MAFSYPQDVPASVCGAGGRATTEFRLAAAALQLPVRCAGGIPVSGGPEGGEAGVQQVERKQN